jgi:D-alanine-D-alanine ligase
MEEGGLSILVVFNLESYIQRGETRDLLAMQETAEIAYSLSQAFSQLNYKVIEMPFCGLLEDLQVQMDRFSRETTFVFNVVDDFEGKSLAAGRVAKVIEDMGFMTTGERAGVMETCMDKGRTKACLIEHGTPTPAYQVYESPDQPFRLNFPVIVKPLVEDASFGIDFESVVKSLPELKARVSYIIEKYRQPALVEEFIAGRELMVGILGNEHLEILPISEVDYSSIDDPFKRILTYEAKWVEDSSYYRATPVRCPADLSQELAWRIRMAAASAYKAAGIVDYGRVDLRLADGVPYVLEVNEAPDLAPGAGFAIAAREAGYSYTQLAERILKIALQRESRRQPRLVESWTPDYHPYSLVSPSLRIHYSMD